MRKAQKRSLLEVVALLCKMHEKMQVFIEKREYENVRLLMSDCMQTILQVGEIVKKVEDDECILNASVHDYHRSLSTILSEKHQSYQSDIIRLLDEKLFDVEKKIKEDIIEKIEIVFMPYKASMWDSLESIWLAAKKDTSCEVHVVPIPYYDRDENSALGKYHYEGAEFPEYVQIENYEDYEIEQRCPDVIYIHNPYDDYNTVTSVNPRFYSGELKKYTDCLVYVPYFVVANENSQVNFLNPSICKNADRIILQSKRVREASIKKLEEDIGISVDADKIIAMGSPKIDSIVNAQKEHFTLPEEWNTLIEGKKVVLYNTSIGSALAETESFMEKLKTTLDVFSKKEDMVLWWRPHPLLQTTFMSIRKEYAEEYRDIVESFKRDRYGIYDETPDFRRAIIYSDLYYGDKKSSLVTLYSVTGKLVVFANIDKNGKTTSFDEDCEMFCRDNSSFDVLLRNENPDGTSGEKIHFYIKNEVLN